MKKIVLLFFVLLCVYPSKAQNYRRDFNAGFEYGLSIVTLCKYTDDFKFFDKIGYGKRIGTTAGIFVNHYISEKYFIESGFYYTLKGTQYRIKQGSSSSYTLRGHNTNIHYIEIPLMGYYYFSDNPYLSLRYGLSYCYQFSNAYENGSIDESIVKDYDLNLSLGLRFKISKIHFFEKCRFLVKYDCSVFSIVEKDEAYLLKEYDAYKILPNQRNMAITFSIQRYFNDFNN